MKETLIYLALSLVLTASCVSDNDALLSALGGVAIGAFSKSIYNAIFG